MFSAQDIKDLREKTGAGMMDCKKALQESNGNMEDAITWLREKGITKAAKKSERIAAEGLTKVLVKGNKAIILEVNSETDFVAKNEEFVKFVDMLAEGLIDSNAKSMEDAENFVIDGEKVSDKVIAITSKIGEKISFRRFEIVEKADDEVFGTYSHMGGKISVVVLLKGSNEEVAKDVAMHACAMRPSYINPEDIPEDVLDKERNIIKEQSINEGKPAEIAEKMVEGRIKKYYKEVCLNEQAFIKDQNVSVGQYAKNADCSIVSMIRYEVGEGMQKREENFAEEVANQING
jgi:translation elongation factor Ts